MRRLAICLLVLLAVSAAQERIVVPIADHCDQPGCLIESAARALNACGRAASERCSELNKEGAAKDDPRRAEFCNADAYTNACSCGKVNGSLACYTPSPVSAVKRGSD